MKLFVTLLGVFCLTTSLMAQGRAGLGMSIDLASFQYDAEQTYLEFSYAFPRSSLTYEQTAEGFAAAAVLNTIIRDDAGKRDPVARMWRVPVVMQDTAGIMQRMLIGVVKFLIPPGKYRISVFARDEQRPTLADSVEIPYEVPMYPVRGIKFSDIQLCASIQKVEADSNNIFYKNTLEVVPNPTLLYGASLPNLLYYAELYHADLDAYQIKTDVISSYGKTMYTRSQKKTGRYPSRVEVGSLPVGTLATGAYTFILSYADTSGKVRNSQSKTFFIFNPDVPQDTTQMQAIAASIAAEFASLAEDELNEQFSMARYVASSDERKLWDAMSGAEAKKKFLTKFWSDRDPDLATPRNELFEQYMQKVRTSNEQFRTAYRPGWKTDRGRVFITYGAPDYVERFSSESDAKPYEVWRYDNIQGGVDFIFVDKGGFNEYDLVHSTMRNEVNNPEWQRHIQTR